MDALQHTVILKNGAKSFFMPNYRLPISKQNVVDQMIEEMKNDGIVLPLKSPYNSPILLVPKKDGGWSLVIDYR